MKISNSTFFLLVGAFHVVLCAPGDLDTSFNTTGVVTTPIIGSSTDVASAVAVYANGKAVVAGSANFGGNWDFAVVRYLRDGALDVTFGGTGKVMTSVGSSHDYATDVHILPDGKVLVTGYALFGGNHRLAAARYLPGGALDTSFGTGGIATMISFGDDRSFASAMLPDGNAVLVGRFTSLGIDRLRAAICSPSGSFTASWDHTMPSSNPAWLTDVAVQSDGKIVAVGRVQVGSSLHIVLTRRNSDLTPDMSFNAGQPLTVLPGGLTSFDAKAVGVQPDGKIVVGGDAVSSGPPHLGIVRFQGNGTLDASFGSGGLVQTLVGSSTELEDLAVSRDGKIVAAALYQAPTSEEPAVLRFTSNGSLDSSFASSGIRTLSFGSSDDYPSACAFSETGRIVLAGTATMSSLDFGVARLRGDGALMMAAPGQMAPGISPLAVFSLIEAPAIIDSGMSAFRATIRGATPAAQAALGAGRTGLWADDQAMRRFLVARVGSPAPGGGNFTMLGHPVASRTPSGLNLIAFAGSVRGGSFTAVTPALWSGAVGVPSTFIRVAHRGQNAPGGGKFEAFPFYAYQPDGFLVFLARISGVTGGTQGIYYADSLGTVYLVVREGQPHPATGKTIRRLQILSSPLAVAGQTRHLGQSAYQYVATFSDGSSGVFQFAPEL